MRRIGWAVVFFMGQAALATETATVGGNTLFEEFRRGGSVMWAILAASLVGCTFLVERLIALRRSAQLPSALIPDLKHVLAREGVEGGRRLLKGNRSALARALDAVLARSGAGRRELEGVLEDEGTRILYDLRRNLRPIGTVAMVTPLLGLLGTVFGMIAAFRQTATLGMDDPRNFASGIYEALYTTAFGLTVAIPCLLAHHALRNHADQIVREVEDRTLSLILVASRKPAEGVSPAQSHPAVS